jgi:hypothetical protein
MTHARFISFAIALTCTYDEGFAQELAKIDFGRDVQPIFRTHCIDCHGPDEQKNGLRLDRRRDALRGGTGTMIGPGNGAASRLYLRVAGNKYGLQMPPDDPLSANKSRSSRHGSTKARTGQTSYREKPHLCLRTRRRRAWCKLYAAAINVPSKKC